MSSLYVEAPARSALMELGVKPPNLVFTDPMESFQIIWMKLPILAAVYGYPTPVVLFGVGAAVHAVPGHAGAGETLCRRWFPCRAA